MAETILVTGASGFIGTHLVAALRATGHDVRTHGIDDSDITSFTPPTGASAIVHLAGRGFVRESWQNTPEFYRVNVQGTVQMLEFCRQARARLVFVSTYVYGQPQSLPIAEDHPRAAPSPYHHSKILAEDACFFYAREFDIPVAIVRLFNVYGPGQGGGFVIPALMRQALASDVARISVADLRPRRDYLYISDFVDFLLAVLARRATGPYNAGCGVSTSMGELIAEVCRAAGADKPVDSRDEFRPNEILDVCADIGKARRDLGWSPRVSLAEGLLRVREAMTA